MLRLLLDDIRDGRTSFERQAAFERMRTALLAWCDAYIKAVDVGREHEVKDFFLAAYQQTVNDRFFELPLVEVKTINCAGATGNWVYCPKCKDGQRWYGNYTMRCLKCGCDFCAVKNPELATRDLCAGEKCETCRWFLKAVKSDEIKKSKYFTFKYIDGFCHRHAPIRIEESGITDLQWPNVKFRDWCGDWESQLVTESHTYVKDGGVLGCSGTVREDGSVKTNKPA
jgi:hypothetical protein